MSSQPPVHVDLDRRIVLNGVELAWGEWGSPSSPTVVLAHGFSGSAHDFALQIPALSDHYRVVALDHRGHGLSMKCGDLDSYSMDQLVADAASFLETVSDQPVTLLGHSMGGRVALGVVLTRPELIRSLILMDTTASEFGVADRERHQVIEAFFAGFDPSAGMPDISLRGPEDALIEESTPVAWRERKAELTAGLDPYAIKALGSALFTGGVESVQGELGRIHCPVTVIVGSNDHPFVDQAPELAAAIAGAQLVVIDGAYHSPQLTHADQWRQAVESHVDALS